MRVFAGAGLETAGPVGALSLHRPRSPLPPIPGPIAEEGRHSSYLHAPVSAVAVEAGARLVILNRGETPLDGAPHLRFEEAIGEVFPPPVRKLEERIGDRAGSTGPTTGTHGR